MRALSFLALIIGLLTGCSSGGRQPPAFYPIAPVTSRGEQRLQVIVAYGYNGPTHTAVRLVDRGEITFWDPGGEYPALADRTYNRRRDVIEGRPATLADYWEYRRALGEAEMLVFEWDLTSREAERLVRALREPDATFDPETQSGYCARAAIDYLNRFFSPRTGAIRPTFSPDALAQHLWQQSADRVLIYRQGQQGPSWHRRVTGIGWGLIRGSTSDYRLSSPTAGKCTIPARGCNRFIADHWTSAPASSESVPLATRAS